MPKDTPAIVVSLLRLLAIELKAEYMRRYMQRHRARQRQLGTYKPQAYDPIKARYMREWRARQPKPKARPRQPAVSYSKEYKAAVMRRWRARHRKPSKWTPEFRSEWTRRWHRQRKLANDPDAVRCRDCQHLSANGRLCALLRVPVEPMDLRLCRDFAMPWPSW